MTILWHYHLALEFPGQIQALRRALPESRIVVAADRDAFFKELPEADVIVSGPLSPEERSAARNMRAHMLPYAGVNALPLAEYSERGVVVANSHGNARTVAERAVALAIAAAGRIVEFHDGLRLGQWARREEAAQIFEYWRSLQHARCTVVGTGAIGSAIAELMSGFGCHFTGVRRRITAGHRQQGTPFHEVTADLHTALERTDVLFLALPLTRETRHLVDEKVLESLNNAILVNVSRGEIVDEEALYRCLAHAASALRGDTSTETSPIRVSAAGIDCWWKYPQPFTSAQLPSTYPFHTLPNVVMSPHAGSHTIEGKRSQLAETIENVRRFVRDGVPLNPVDISTGY